MKRHKIWAGLSSVVLATSPAALAASSGAGVTNGPVQVAQARTASGEAGESGAHASAHSGQGGEKGAAPHSRHGGEAGEAGKTSKAGGEGGEGGGEGGQTAGLPPNLRLHRDIELIRGHLLVGTELVDAGQWTEAMPHFLHPQEEIYGGMREGLKDLGIPPFLAALKALAQTVKAKNGEAFARAQSAVEERLSAAEKAVRGKEAAWPSFALESMLEVLQTAADEYEAAIADGKISNVVEYQDSRGFVLEAKRLFQSISDELVRKDREATQAVGSALDDLEAAWPSLQPPQVPVRDHGAVLSDISRIELQLAHLR